MRLTGARKEALRDQDKFLQDVLKKERVDSDELGNTFEKNYYFFTESAFLEFRRNS